MLQAPPPPPSFPQWGRTLCFRHISRATRAESYMHTCTPTWPSKSVATAQKETVEGSQGIGDEGCALRRAMHAMLPCHHHFRQQGASCVVPRVVWVGAGDCGPQAPWPRASSPAGIHVALLPESWPWASGACCQVATLACLLAAAGEATACHFPWPWSPACKKALPPGVAAAAACSWQKNAAAGMRTGAG